MEIAGFVAFLVLCSYVVISVMWIVLGAFTEQLFLPRTFYRAIHAPFKWFGWYHDWATEKGRQRRREWGEL